MQTNDPYDIRRMIVSVRQAAFTLNGLLDEFGVLYFTSHKEYLEYMIKYIFYDKNKFFGATQYTECRSMLSQYILSEEQLYFIEHRVMLSLLEELTPVLDLVSFYNHFNNIRGINWEINKQWDLLIEFVR